MNELLVCQYAFFGVKFQKLRRTQFFGRGGSTGKANSRNSGLRIIHFIFILFIFHNTIPKVDRLPFSSFNMTFIFIFFKLS